MAITLQMMSSSGLHEHLSYLTSTTITDTNNYNYIS